jgi:hypothetical protein
MAVLADRWEAMGCLWQCMQHLAATAPEQLTLADLTLLTAEGLPSSITQHACSAAVQAVCLKQLLQLFGEVQTVIVSSQLRADFCTLPFAAVKLWAGSDQLAVDSENSVVLLLTHWWLENHGSAAPDRVAAARGRELVGLLRLSHISSCFLHTVLFQLPWFMPLQHQLAAFAQISCLKSRNIPIPVFSNKYTQLPLPWLQPPRCVSQQQQHSLRWQVHVNHIKELHDNAITIRPPLECPEQLYWAGYKWQLGLFLSSQQAELRLCFRIEPLEIGVCKGLRCAPE